MKPHIAIGAALAPVVLLLAGGGGVSAAQADTTPTMTVTPASNLANNQKVTVTLSGFTANKSLFIAQCTVAAATAQNVGGCDAGTLVQVTPNASGQASATVTVHSGKSFVNYSSAEKGTCDVHSPCDIVATDAVIGTPAEYVTAGVTFASPPPATSTTVSASRKKVVAGKKVVVTATTKATATGAAVPAGAVVFTDNGKKVGAIAETASGKVKLRLKIGKGSHTIVASYAGTGSFSPSAGTVKIVGKANHKR